MVTKWSARPPQLALALAIVGLALGARDAPPLVATSNPCSGIAAMPGPPPGEPEPLIGGAVWDADADDGVPGASVALYRCAAGTPVLVDTATTGGDGGFAFAASTGPAWYVVEVVEGGVLAGMAPTGATVNPSSPIEVGPGDDGLFFAFEP